MRLVGVGDLESRKGSGKERRRSAGGEPVKGVCVWRLTGKNADKLAPRILGLKAFSFCMCCRM